MTEDEMNTVVDDWFNALTSDDEAVAYERARMENNAHNSKAEYWFMKGWVARNA
jgi:hypothetical protein